MSAVGFVRARPIRLPCLAPVRFEGCGCHSHVPATVCCSRLSSRADHPPGERRSSPGMDQASPADAAFVRRQRRFVGQLRLRPLSLFSLKALRAPRARPDRGRPSRSLFGRVSNTEADLKITVSGIDPCITCASRFTARVAADRAARLQRLGAADRLRSTGRSTPSPPRHRHHGTTGDELHQAGEERPLAVHPDAFSHSRWAPAA